MSYCVILNFINFTILSQTCHTTVTTLSDNLIILNFKRGILNMKPLIKMIVEKSIKNGGYYSIDYEQGDEYQKRTNDISLLCNQKEGDQYIGVNNLDCCYINIYDKNKDNVGYIHWIAWNDGTDRISDYCISLDSIIKSVSKQWENQYNRL